VGGTCARNNSNGCLHDSVLVSLQTAWTVLLLRLAIVGS